MVRPKRWGSGFLRFFTGSKLCSDVIELCFELIQLLIDTLQARYGCRCPIIGQFLVERSRICTCLSTHSAGRNTVQCLIGTRCRRGTRRRQSVGSLWRRCRGLQWHWRWHGVEVRRGLNVPNGVFAGLRIARFRGNLCRRVRERDRPRMWWRWWRRCLHAM